MRTCRHNTQVTLSQGYGFLWLETTTDSVSWLIIWTFFSFVLVVAAWDFQIFHPVWMSVCLRDVLCQWVKTLFALLFRKYKKRLSACQLPAFSPLLYPTMLFLSFTCLWFMVRICIFANPPMTEVFFKRARWFSSFTSAP